MSLPEIVAWKVESLRLSMFFSTPVSAQNQNWWKHFTGSDPETTLNKLQLGEYMENGPLLGGQGELKVGIDRVDWAVSFPMADMPNAPSPKALKALLLEWIEGIRNWLAAINLSPHRIGLGVFANCPVKKEDEANSIISDYFRFVDLRLGGRFIDASMQINEPKPSMLVENLVINRILRLEVLNRQIVTVGPSGMPAPIEDTVVRARVDINTSPAWQSSFAPDSVISLFEEIGQHVETLLSKGFE